MRKISFPLFFAIFIAQIGYNTPIIATEKIILVEEGEWPPYTYESSGAPTKGVSFELMTEIFHRLNKPFTINLLPMKRCIFELTTGDCDAITMLSRNNEREEFLVFTHPIVESKGFVYYDSYRHPKFEWNSFADLQPYTIGTVSGYNYGSDFEDICRRYKLKTERVSRIDQNFRKLLAGRIDILLVNQTEVNEFMRTHPQYRSRIRSAGTPYHVYSYHMAFSKKSRHLDLIPKINRVITDMKNDGTADRILSKYIH